MGCVVCATRGGEGSRALQRRAISLARETGERLVFLYVTDSGSLGNFDHSLITAVEYELNWMGKTLLGIAQERANLAHIEAEIVIRAGEVRGEIERFLHEARADRLLLGAPRGTTANVFGDDAIEQFAQAIQEKTGVPVEIARPEIA